MQIRREKVKVDDLTVFKDFILAWERENGLKQFRVMPAGNFNEWVSICKYVLTVYRYHRIQMPEPVYNAWDLDNVEFDTDEFKYGYTSLTTPKSVFVYNMKDRTSTLKKEQKVLGGYDKNLYQTG